MPCTQRHPYTLMPNMQQMSTGLSRPTTIFRKLGISKFKINNLVIWCEVCCVRLWSLLVIYSLTQPLCIVKLYMVNDR